MAAPNRRNPAFQVTLTVIREGGFFIVAGRSDKGEERGLWALADSLEGAGYGALGVLSFLNDRPDVLGKAWATAWRKETGQPWKVQPSTNAPGGRA